MRFVIAGSSGNHLGKSVKAKYVSMPAVESALRVTRSHRQSLLLLPGLAPVASSGFENSKKGGMDFAQKGDGHDGDREDYGIGVLGSASFGTHSMRRTKAAQIYRKAAASARGYSCSAIRNLKAPDTSELR
jgi:hypothetical protein